MIIESKFHDYYDPVVKTAGRDKKVVFKRLEKKLEGKEVEDFKEILPFLSSTLNLIDKDKSLGGVIFCGRLYPILHVREYKYSPYFEIKEKLIYGINKIRQELQSDRELRWDAKKLDELEAACKKDYSYLCIKYKTPTILMETKGWGIADSGELKATLNPELKKLGFQKIKSPVEAWQEIFSYVSGVLTNPMKEPRPVSDKLKAVSHGFNKFSFRRDTPPKRKLKKQRVKDKEINL